MNLFIHIYCPNVVNRTVFSIHFGENMAPWCSSSKSIEKHDWPTASAPFANEQQRQCEELFFKTSIKFTAKIVRLLNSQSIIVARSTCARVLAANDFRRKINRFSPSVLYIDQTTHISNVCEQHSGPHRIYSVGAYILCTVDITEYTYRVFQTTSVKQLQRRVWVCGRNF